MAGALPFLTLPRALLADTALAANRPRSPRSLPAGRHRVYMLNRVRRVCVRFQYFACADNYGTIVVPDKVTIVEASSLSVSHMRALGVVLQTTAVSPACAHVSVSPPPAPPTHSG